MPAVFRLFYWGGLIVGSVPLAYAVRTAITARFGFSSQALLGIVTSLAFSVLYTPVVYLATLLATQNGYALMMSIWTLWQGTFLAAACAYTIRALVMESDHVDPEKAVDPDPPMPRLLQRIDSTLHGPLVSISVRDHYVDVRTSVGNASLLMRLSDAIAETDGVSGSQVHRSHWVAWGAVLGVDRRGGTVILRLTHGEAIPVSRNYREKLAGRGLI